MDFSTWVLFLLTETALIISPGPAVLYVFSQGLTRGARPAAAASLGILSGNAIYFVLSAIGLGALILASHTVFLVIKWAGVAYLIWLGVRAFTGSFRLESRQPAVPVPARRLFRGGLVLQLANPKNLVFFMAILPPFIDPQGNIPLQVFILGLTSMTIELVVLLLYGALASGAHRWVRESRFVRWIDRTVGAILVAIGISLAFVRRA